MEHAYSTRGIFGSMYSLHCCTRIRGISLEGNEVGGDSIAMSRLLVSASSAGRRTDGHAICSYKEFRHVRSRISQQSFDFGAIL